jgi:beta-lactamase class A
MIFHEEQPFVSRFEFPSSSRRWFIGAASAALCSAAGGATREQQGIVERLTAIRSRIGGRLGVHVLDTHTGRRFGIDDDARFAMASTFKWLLAAAVLAKVERAELRLERRVAFTEKDMLAHAPVTSKHLAQGSLTVRELCAAVVEVSDNPAANLLLRLIDGPEGLTKFVRESGDGITRLDRTELALNSNLPGDPRDTTTPRAMVGSMERVLTGTVLSGPSRQMLIQWMIDSSTGLQRIRAGLPAGWKAGDKTGTGANGAVNNLAIAWPPGRKPLLIAVYLSESTQTIEMLSAAHAQIAAEVVRELR